MSTTNATNFKFSVFILFSIIVGMSVYIYDKNVSQNIVKASLLSNNLEKNQTLKDLEFLKLKYDEAISENISLTDEIVAERQKVIALIDQIKNNTSNLYYKNKLSEAKSQMSNLLDENYKVKQKNIPFQDTIYSSYQKLAKQNKNLLRQNEDLSKAVKRGATLSISNLKAVSFRAKNSGRLIVTQNSKRANLLKIGYTINENLLTKNEEKYFYTQIVDPQNNIIGETKLATSANELRYTFANKVNYESKAIEIDHDLPFESFVKGKYYITIFDYNGVVGKTSFMMK